MALTRKFLSALGIEAEKIDEIISAHVETVDGLKDENSALKTQAEKAEALEKENAELRAAAENSSKDPYKVKYEAIKEEYEQYKSDVSAKQAKSAKESAYRALLKEAGVSEKRIDAVLRVSDIGKLNLDADGNIEDAKSVMDGIRSEWADFIVTESPKGAAVPTPPSGGGPADPNELSDEEYYKNFYKKS